MMLKEHHETRTLLI